MKDQVLRDFTLPAVALLAFAVLAALGALGGHSGHCSVAIGDPDCVPEGTSLFLAETNGAVFDRVNLLAGHVPLVDHAMEFAARYAIFAIAGAVALSWFVRNCPDGTRRRAVYTAVLGAALALAVTQAIQHFYAHERPFVLRADVMLLVKHSADPSFPSEHTAVAFALAAGIGLYRARLGVVLLLLAALTAFSRVYVGLHYPADVGVGAVIGIAAAFLVSTATPVLDRLDASFVLRILPPRLH